jgi:CubicO group peptidase (beta-lactamase class C family)
MSNQLTGGQQLTENQRLTSSNGRAYLVMQTDGNLVLYRADNGLALWASGTSKPSGASGPNYTFMQIDGNLVVYTVANAPLWSSGTYGNPGAYLVLEDSGNLVVYSATSTPLWFSNTVQWEFTPSLVAAHAIWPTVLVYAPGQVYLNQSLAPGWEYKLRLNGGEYADAPYGLAQAALPMRNDTIIHVASMSKPVCVTAFVAMREDWMELANAVKGAGPLSAVHKVETPSLHLATPKVRPPVHEVPQWLLPALSNAALAEKLVEEGLLKIVPQHLHAVVDGIAGRRIAHLPHVFVPPGFSGLLGLVLAGVAVPALEDPFLPLIQAKLQAKAAGLGISWQPGTGVRNVTLDQIITHTSAIRDGITDQSIFNAIPTAHTFEPTDGSRATCDIWAYLLAFLSQPADGNTGYKNDDYNVLGGVVEACVGMDYDDYVYARLFSDPQFGALRRYVTDPSNSAHYYSGLGPNFSGGIPFPDYRGWGASGGFYYAADQITQWLYALKSGANVQGPRGVGTSAPLVSADGRALLFEQKAYFAAGARNQVSGWTSYTHNGGTGVGSGSVNGDMGIAVGPSGDIMTAFFCANGSLNANPPFDAALSAILQYSYPP